MSKKKEDTKRGIFNNPFVLVGIITIVAILLINGQPEGSLLSGKVIIGEDFIGDISGEWLVEEENWEECYRPHITREDTSRMVIRQVNEKITIDYYEEFESVITEVLLGRLEGNEMILTGMDIEKSSRYGGADKMSLDVTNIKGIIFSNCNKFKIEGNWTETEGPNVCNGHIVMEGTRKNPIGCGVSNVCIEEWDCSGWSACTDNAQTRTCTDSKGCGTIKNKPVESQNCALPAPALPWSKMLLWIFALALLGVGTFFGVKKLKKEDPTGLLNEIVERANNSLRIGDVKGAITDYGLLKESLERNKNKIPKKDADRLFKEAIRIYGKISKK